MKRDLVSTKLNELQVAVQTAPTELLKSYFDDLKTQINQDFQQAKEAEKNTNKLEQINLQNAEYIKKIDNFYANALNECPLKHDAKFEHYLADMQLKLKELGENNELNLKKLKDILKLLYDTLFELRQAIFGNKAYLYLDKASIPEFNSRYLTPDVILPVNQPAGVVLNVSDAFFEKDLNK